MSQITIEYAGEIRTAEASSGESVLDVLQAQGIPIQATCGGAGKCGRCQVLVADASGVRVTLACVEPALDGIRVVVDKPHEAAIVEDGQADQRQFKCDDGQQGYGLAVDIGTTTMAAHLHDRETGVRLASASCMNPQAAFGADVISRISASVEGKLENMYTLVVDAMVALRDELLSERGAKPEECTAVSIAGNTVMQHIAVALPPDTIGVNPFTPLSLFGDYHELPKLGSCYLAPCVAGYVGGDITAGMLARGLDEGKPCLFIDLGTNGEMALSRDGRIVACATAAGPVFEGANITFGMPAASGAISQVAVAGPGELSISVIDNGMAIGVCGTGIVDAVAAMLDADVVDETGYLKDVDEVDEPWAPFIGQEQGQRVFYLTDDHAVYITQNDVRNVQLAKAAVCGGVRTMLEARKMTTDQIESVEIAGGFGRYLSVRSAARIGLFPPELADRAASVGNTSAEGASMMLLSEEERTRAQTIAKQCAYLELSTSAAFNGYYVDEMEFPEG